MELKRQGPYKSQFYKKLLGALRFRENGLAITFTWTNAKTFSSDQLKTFDNFSLPYIRWGLLDTMVYSGSSRRLKINHMFRLGEV